MEEGVKGGACAVHFTLDALRHRRYNRDTERGISS